MSIFLREFVFVIHHQSDCEKDYNRNYNYGHYTGWYNTTCFFCAYSVLLDASAVQSTLGG